MTNFTREDGFSLMELLIVTAIAGMVVASIFAVYMVSQQTYTRATSLEDAQLGARAGLDRMATELRLIGAYLTGATNAPAAIIAPFTPTSITFLGDVDADTAPNNAETTVTGNPDTTTIVVSGNAAAFTYPPPNATPKDYVHITNGARREVTPIAAVNVGVNTITLATGLTSTFTAGASTFVRSVERVTYTLNGTTITRQVGGNPAEPAVENVTALTLSYFDDSNNPTANPSLIREIQIDLTTRGSDGSLRRMLSRVRPRNLGIQE